MADIDPIWWILIAIAFVIVIALIVWAAVSSRKKAEAARTRAAGLREVAREGEPSVASAEEHASDLQRQAREAQQEADRLHEEAERATEAARTQRDHVTGEYLEADEIDPDAKRRGN